MSVLGNNLLAQYYAQNQYKDIDYIMSPLLDASNNTYIDSGVMSGRDDLIIELEFKYEPHRAYESIFKSYLDESHNTTRLILDSQPFGLLGYVNTKARGGYTSIGNAVANAWHRLIMYQGGAICDGVTYTGFTAKGDDYSAVITILNSSAYIRKYLKSMKISDANGTIRNLVAKLRADGKPGLYDLCGSICSLTGTPFYINAGTGEFVTP